MNLPLISIRRPVFAFMLIASLVVLGLVSIYRLDLDLNPRVDFPFVTVTTLLPGAAPETIETEVTDILEEEINTIEGIRTLSSTSMEGLSNIFVEFDLGYDIDVKAQQVREKIAPVRHRLPLDIEEPIVSQVDPDAAPILSVMLGGPVSLKQLSDLAENVVASGWVERASANGGAPAGPAAAVLDVAVGSAYTGIYDRPDLGRRDLRRLSTVLAADVVYRSTTGPNGTSAPNSSRPRATGRLTSRPRGQSRRHPVLLPAVAVRPPPSCRSGPVLKPRAEASIRG